jgi:hypothetical protein
MAFWVTPNALFFRLKLSTFCLLPLPTDEYFITSIPILREMKLNLSYAVSTQKYGNLLVKRCKEQGDLTFSTPQLFSASINFTLVLLKA